MSKRKLTVNIVSLCLLACICVGAFVMARVARDRAAALAEESVKVPVEEQVTDESVEEQVTDEPVEESVMIGLGVEKKTYEGKDYFIRRAWYPSSNYDMRYVVYEDDKWPDSSDYSARLALDYAGYQAYCERCDLMQAYHDPDKTYLIVSEMGMTVVSVHEVDLHDDNADVYVDWEYHEAAEGCMAVIIIPIDHPVQNVTVHDVCTEKEFENIVQYGTPWEPGYEPAAEKPIIYLYPEKETDVTVTLGHPECITHSYPKYDGPWRVTARPDGTLTDLETGRELYSLYYENVSPIPLPQTDEGFVVRGEDTAAFLEEKLALLGLSPREAEEFIVYWLPRLEENEWNYIRFASGAEIDAEMPLEITPQPDTMIRVLMLWKPLDAPIEVREQTLTNPPRTGFTCVEWGGAELTK